MKLPASSKKIKTPRIKINLVSKERAVRYQPAHCRDCAATGEALHELNYPEGKVYLCRMCFVRTKRIQERILPNVKTLSMNDVGERMGRRSVI